MSDLTARIEVLRGLAREYNHSRYQLAKALLRAVEALEYYEKHEHDRNGHPWSATKALDDIGKILKV